MTLETPRFGTRGSRREEYISRVNRVLDYIESNLDRAFTLEELASVACFSPFHFHRIFGAMVGETLHQFIQRIRLEKAATQLISQRRKSITRIALDCGFSGSATFARAFKDAYGMSASEWRAGGHLRYRKDRKADRNQGKDAASLPEYSDRAIGDGDIRFSAPDRREEKEMPGTVEGQVRVEDVQPFHVAYVRHVGPYKGDARLFEDLFNRLMMWAGPRELLGLPDTKVLIIYHDDPAITEDAKLRVSVCISVPEDTPVEGEIGKMAMPGGRYAFARFELADDQYQQAWDYVFARWLPDSGYQPDDRPCFEMYHGKAEERPEARQVVDICVPVRPL